MGHLTKELVHRERLQELEWIRLRVEFEAVEQVLAIFAEALLWWLFGRRFRAVLCVGTREVVLVLVHFFPSFLPFRRRRGAFPCRVASGLLRLIAKLIVKVLDYDRV